MTTYSPQLTAWQLIVASVLDDDPRDDADHPDGLDALLAGADDDALMVLFAAVGMAAELLGVLAAARGLGAIELVRQLGPGMALADESAPPTLE